MEPTQQADATNLTLYYGLDSVDVVPEGAVVEITIDPHRPHELEGFCGTRDMAECFEFLTISAGDEVRELQRTDDDGPRWTPVGALFVKANHEVTLKVRAKKEARATVTAIGAPWEAGWEGVDEQHVFIGHPEVAAGEQADARFSFQFATPSEFTPIRFRFPEDIIASFNILGVALDGEALLQLPAGDHMTLAMWSEDSVCPPLRPVEGNELVLTVINTTSTPQHFHGELIIKRVPRAMNVPQLSAEDIAKAAAWSALSTRERSEIMITECLEKGDKKGAERVREMQRRAEDRERPIQEVARERSALLEKFGGVVHHIRTADTYEAEQTACGDAAMTAPPMEEPFYLITAGMRGAATDIAVSQQWPQVTCETCLDKRPLL